MKKNYFIISIFPIFFPILIALMYAAGLNYYGSYLRAFGIPYGIFNMGINDVLFFGGAALAIYLYKIIKYAMIISLVICFSISLLRWIVKKFNLLSYFQADPKNNDSASRVEIYLISFCCYMLFIIALIYAFVNVIQFSSEHGEKMGSKHKSEYNKTLLLIKKNNNKIEDTDALLVKMNNHTADKIGYIIASKEDVVALYTVKGLVFEKMSNINEFQKHK